jgi:hypothetical protein
MACYRLPTIQSQLVKIHSSNICVWVSSQDLLSPRFIAQALVLHRITTPTPTALSLGPSDKKLLPQFVSTAHQNVRAFAPYPHPMPPNQSCSVECKSYSFLRWLDGFSVVFNECRDGKQPHSFRENYYRHRTTI